MTAVGLSIVPGVLLSVAESCMKKGPAKSRAKRGEETS